MSNTTNTTNISMNKTYDIHERIYKFIVRVIILVNKLPKTPSNLVIIAQILESVTSMGANDQEADGSLTKKDFIHGFTIVRKEGKETNFWLRLIERTNDEKFRNEALIFVQESNEIVAIVSTIIKNAENNGKDRK